MQDDSIHTIEDIPHLIRQQTWRKFRTIYQRKFKKPYSQDTFIVLSSLSFIHRHTLRYKIISIGLGTKSLPHSILTEANTKDLISDMHGEMLAVRGLRRFLCQQIQDNKAQYLQWNDKRQKYSLKPQYEIYLYCSEVFCGDCCISEEDESFSGAKPLAYLHHQKYPNYKFAQHVLRTKPGRMDLPLQKRSALLSCSDQIALSNLLGLQGKKLFSIITPVYLSKIIIDGHPRLQPKIEKGTNFIVRLSHLLPRSQSLLSRQIFKIVVDGKERTISSQFQHHTPTIIFNPKEQSRNRQGFELCGIFIQEREEWLNGKTGLPQGSSLSNYFKKGKVSMLSQAALEKQFSFYSSNEYTFKYQAILERIKKLFGEWLQGAGQ